MTVLPGPVANRMRGTDWLILIIVSIALFGAAAVSGRPLSIHEARVPQLAREMVEGRSDWILPQSGGRPWLERPPLPHWFTAAAMKLFGRTDALWVVRFPPAVMGCVIALTGAWMAARWFGRGVGLLVGLVLATSYEVYQYASLAEDDIYLGAVAVGCMAMFVKSEWRSGLRSGPGPDSGAEPDAGSVHFAGGRPWPVVAFFVLLGLTNLAKGPIVGAVPIVATVAAYLLLNRDGRQIRRYAWLWGWLIFLGLTVAWPYWAYRHYPDVWDNWRFDYLGQSTGNAARQWDEPRWYYLAVLPLSLAPWTWATVIGLFATARTAWRTPHAPERLLWCWAWMGLIVLSLPARKHHHYLVPVIAPWAILGGLGLLPVGRLLMAGHRAALAKRPWIGPLVVGAPVAIAIVVFRARLPANDAWAALLAAAWLACVSLFCYGISRGRPGWLAGAVVTGFVATGSWVQFTVAGRDAATLAETEFLRQVEATVPAGEPIFVNANTGSLGFFRLQFGLRRPHRLLHNLTFLRDQEITAPVVHVIARADDRPTLDGLGETEVLIQTAVARRGVADGRRFTLFRVALPPDLPRYPRPSYVGVMQAMERAKGPWCGDPPRVAKPKSKP